MSKILLSVSDRWVPDARIDAIASFVQRLGHQILVTHVVYGAESGGGEPLPGERVLEKIATQMRDKQTKVETLLLFSDDVGQAILKTAEEHKVVMIMLGLSSKGMLTRLIEGNVAQEVVRGTKIPVLLLPPEWGGEI